MTIHHTECSRLITEVIDDIPYYIIYAKVVGWVTTLGAAGVVGFLFLEQLVERKKGFVGLQLVLVFLLSTAIKDSCLNSCRGQNLFVC